MQASTRLAMLRRMADVDRFDSDLAGRVVWAALLSGTVALLLLALSLSTGTSHIAFQLVRPASEVAELLLARGSLLRVELGLDYLFLCLYTALFAATHDLLRAWDRRSARAPVWLGLLLGSAILDAVENAHLLALLPAVERGLSIPQVEVNAQAVIGHLKFAMNYAGLLVLSFALPDRTRLERGLVIFLRWIQAPLGAAVLTLPPGFVRPFGLLRVLGFIAALWAWARIARARRTVRE
jgi:hypothetical protein